MSTGTGKRDVVWADGLRGIASVLVVTAHICRSLAPHLLSPAMSEKLPPMLFQLPFIRCLVMGRASVAAFALLAGYVNSLSPIKKSRAGNVEGALSGIAKSAFRRTGRFIFPAMIATTLSWLVCQFGGYRVAKMASSNWIRDTSPDPSPSFAAAIYDLCESLARTWLDGANQYDKIQWTLTFLLKGSMMTYLTLFSLVYVKPRWRMIILCGLFYFKWMGGDAVVGFNVFMGILLAEITLDSELQAAVAAYPVLQSVLSASAIILGLYFCSYPEENQHWSSWSANLTRLGDRIFPHGVEFTRYYPGLGVDILTTGIMFNTTAKKVLSHPFFCWMGKLSFPIYLLHAPMIRTVLAYALFGFSVQPSGGRDESGNELPPGWLPVANRWICVFAIPLFYVFLYRVAQLWAQHVDPFCARVTQWFEDLVFREDAKVMQEKPLLLS